jgi:hypothetical protein
MSKRVVLTKNDFWCAVLGKGQFGPFAPKIDWMMLELKIFSLVKKEWVEKV